MTGYTADEKLRYEQLIKLRRQWLKDQELTSREPVTAPKPPGRIARFWAGFLEPKTLWRLYTFKAYNAGVFAVTRLLIPAWVVHYYMKYHVAIFGHSAHLYKSVSSCVCKYNGVMNCKMDSLCRACLCKMPYGIVELKPRLFPGDIVLETGEVVPDLPEADSHGHH